MDQLFYASPYEIYECRFLRTNKSGLSGSRKYRIPSWEDVELNDFAQYGVPVLGEPWGWNLPYLVVTNISFQEYGNSYVDVAVEYSSEGYISSDFIKTSLSFGMDNMQCGPGWHWESSGLPVNEEINFVVPAGTYSVTVKDSNFSRNNVISALNYVNSGTWHGFPAETLLFLGADTNYSYSSTGGVTGVEATYKFSVKAYSHNYMFRKPVQRKYWDGTPVVYHDIAELSQTAPYSAAYLNPNVQANLAYIGTPMYVSGPAGVAGWDKPCINAYDPWHTTPTTTYMHPLCDFSAVLGIPNIAEPTPPQPDPAPQPDPESSGEGE